MILIVLKIINNTQQNFSYGEISLSFLIFRLREDPDMIRINLASAKDDDKETCWWRRKGHFIFNRWPKRAPWWVQATDGVFRQSVELVSAQRAPG